MVTASQNHCFQRTFQRLGRNRARSSGLQHQLQVRKLEPGPAGTDARYDAAAGRLRVTRTPGKRPHGHSEAAEQFGHTTEYRACVYVALFLGEA
eukprot:2754066-Rhodomonas_salina.1